MDKSKAIKLLGGSVTAAAAAVRVSASAVSQWPEVLSPALEDRVLAALARKHLLLEVLEGGERAPSIPTQEASHAE